MKNIWSLQKESILVCIFFHVYISLFNYMSQILEVLEHFCSLKMYTVWNGLSTDAMEASLQCCHLHALHFRFSMAQPRMQAAWVSVIFLFGFGLFFVACFCLFVCFFLLVPSCCVFSLQHSSLWLLESLYWLLQIQRILILMDSGLLW